MKFSAFRICAFVGLTGLALVGFYSHAQPTAVASNPAVVANIKPAAANNKVIVYQAANESLAQLKAKGITRVTNYGSYWLVEATDAQVDQLTQMYGSRAVKDSRFNRVQLNGVTIETTSGEPSVPAAFREKEGPGKRLRLVQFRGPILPEWLLLLQANRAEIISYIPNDAYLVRIDQSAEDKLRALVGTNGPIQWLGPYHPYYKIQPGLWTEGDQKNDSLVNVRVMVAPHSENSDTMKAIEKIGFVDYSYDRANETAQFLTVPVSAVADMARLPDVIWIEKVYPKRLLDEVQDLVLAGQTNGLGHGPEGATTGFTNYLDFLVTQVAGSQIDAFVNPLTYPVVDVADTGIDSGPLGGTVAFDTNKPDVVEAPVHPAFHFLGDARNFSRVVYDAPPWIGGDPASQLGCPSVYLGANDGPFKHIESMDLVGHGTAVASIIAGFDDGTNILNEPCLQLHSASNTWLVTLPGTSITDTNNGSVVPITNGVISCAISTNITIPLPTGFSETCGPGGTPPNATFTNVVFTISSNSCPTNVFVDVLYTSIVTNNLTQIRVDGNGNQLGMGVSPFGLLGNSRIWENYSSDLSISGTAPGTGIFGLGVLALSGGCNEGQFVTDLGKCVTDIPSLIALAYFSGEGARIQNNSWADNIGVPPTAGGQYDADCVSYDIAVRDASLVGSSNNIPGPSPLNQEFIVVFACASSFSDAGNNSGVGGFPDIFITAPATAKNVISVGVADNPRDLTNSTGCVGGDSLEMPIFAATSPTLDGRFKPEIVAPGANVYAALSQIVAVTTNCTLDKTLFPAYPGIVACTNPPCDGTQGPIYTDLYGCVGGSSYAAPAVSGAIQLLWWYFQNRLTNEVGNALLQPSPAMAKAYLCNSARYLPISATLNPSNVVFDTLPSTLQGMGELDLARMFDGVGRAIRDESSPRAISVPLVTTNPVVQQTYFSQSGQSYELTGQIASNGLPFRVTVAWLDPPGNPVVQTGPQLINDLDLQVTIPYPGGPTYKGNQFKENVSVPGGTFDSVNNMESVFLNPVGWLNGSTNVAAGTPFQIIVRASNIAGQGVPNVGETIGGGSNILNQDFALVVYNAATNTLSDVPNLGLQTNNSCSTPMILTQFPFTFTNSLTNSVYANVQPSPSAATGGDDEFFKIPQPTAGTTFNVDTIGSDFDTVLSVWSVPVLPSTILVRGECGYLTEVVSTNDPGGSGRSAISFTADGSNDYYIVAEPHNGGSGGTLVLNVRRQCEVTLFPDSLPSSRLGAFYDAQVTASGGAPPFTFTVSPTNGLPPGLTLSKASGAIGGVPTNTGTYTFTITATDALGCSASGVYTISIECPSLTLEPPVLPAALDGRAYSNVISAIGGQNPINFSLAVGPLPNGLTLSPSGLLSGIPAVVETTSNKVFSFKVQAVDTNGCSGSMYYTISVNCPNITFTTSQNSLPVGTEFQPYPPVQLVATGGAVTVTSPYVFSQTGGSLPAGMVLTSGGMITGTPTSVSSVFTATATDANGCKGSMTYTLPLNDPLPPPNTNATVLNVGPSFLPAGVVGQNYLSTLAASGGTPPYVFTVPPDSLPAGLQLSNAGTLSGTPTTEGNFSFTITATDAGSNSGSMTYAVTVTSKVDLAVFFSAPSPQPVLLGSNLTCSLTVTNFGPSPATGVTVTNLLPSGVTFVSASTGCAADGNTVVCDIGNLPAGAGADISYIVTSSATGTVSFSASVAGNQTDSNIGNNTVSFNDTVVPPYTVASNPKAITDVDGDIVSVTLKGKGAMEVRVLGGDNHGPIDQIVLTGTTTSSTLTIQVKKRPGGDGFVNIGSIVSDGSLNAITGNAVNLTGAGIQVAGSLGSVTVNTLNNTTVSVGGPVRSVAAKTYSATKISAVKIGSVKLGTVTGGSANQITVQQSGGTVTVASPRSKWKITTSSQPSGFQVTVIP